jgi:hypothetical protein
MIDFNKYEIEVTPKLLKKDLIKILKKNGLLEHFLNNPEHIFFIKFLYEKNIYKKYLTLLKRSPIFFYNPYSFFIHINMNSQWVIYINNIKKNNIYKNNIYVQEIDYWKKEQFKLYSISKKIKIIIKLLYSKFKKYLNNNN